MPCKHIFLEDIIQDRFLDDQSWDHFLMDSEECGFEIYQQREIQCVPVGPVERLPDAHHFKEQMELLTNNYYRNYHDEAKRATIEKEILQLVQLTDQLTLEEPKAEVHASKKAGRPPKIKGRRIRPTLTNLTKRVFFLSFFHPALRAPHFCS